MNKNIEHEVFNFLEMIIFQDGYKVKDLIKPSVMLRDRIIGDQCIHTFIKGGGTYVWYKTTCGENNATEVDYEWNRRDLNFCKYCGSPRIQVGDES